MVSLLLLEERKMKGICEFPGNDKTLLLLGNHQKLSPHKRRKGNGKWTAILTAFTTCHRLPLTAFQKLFVLFSCLSLGK